MKHIIILKGILFYSTFAAVMLYMCAIDGICDKGYIAETTVIVVLLISISCMTITKEDYMFITSSKFFKSIFKGK